jgi:hypothetical protein
MDRNKSAARIAPALKNGPRIEKGKVFPSDP